MVVERAGVRLRPQAEPRYTVTLSSRAWRDISDDLWTNRALTERGYELGGWLQGSRTWSWHKSIRIASAPCAGPAARSFFRGFDLDLVEGDLVEREAARYDSDGIRLIGSWHTHPGRPPDPRPSDTDRAHWNGERNHFQRNFIGLILTESRDRGWIRPDVHGWVTYRDDLGRDVCEPVRVERQA